MAALRAEPANRGVRATWTPARGGISADGLHGFTLGTMEVAPAPTRDSSHAAAGEGTPRRGAKYLAYWVRGEAGWRVAAYKRAPRPSAGAALDPMSPALPPRMVAPSTDEARVAGLERGLRAAEQAFSDEAQRIGLGPAFARHGSPDATNMGGPDESGFLVGADAIGRAVGGPDPSAPSPVAWSADEVLVASSGDLGITFGMIRPHAPIAGQPAGFPFFTIWRRSDPADPWRYVAE